MNRVYRAPRRPNRTFATLLPFPAKSYHAQAGRYLKLIAIAAFLLVGATWGLKQFQAEPFIVELPRHFYMPGLFTASNSIGTDSMALAPLPEQNEDVVLTQKLLDVMVRYPADLTPHIYYLNLKTGAYVNINGNAAVPAASVIKLPLLLEYYRAVSDKTITPGDEWLYQWFHQAGGSGTLQFTGPGVYLTVDELAHRMIQESDNTATNMFIDSLGGIAQLNDRFQRMGLKRTSLHAWLPDLGGTNLISAKDMSKVLYNIYVGHGITQACRASAMEVLEGTHNRRLLPAGLPDGSIIAHKTGDIGESLGDSGLITLPDGTQYLLSIQVKRPYNNGDAKQLIIALSQAISESLYTPAQLSPTPAAELAASETETGDAVPQ